MAKETSAGACCSPEAGMKVDAIVSCDERGQMVLPKELRKKAGIASGDKLALVSHEKDGQTCCITLIRTEALAGLVKGLLGPLMKDILE